MKTKNNSGEVGKHNNIQRIQRWSWAFRASGSATSSASRTRTYNPAVNSRMLYH